MSRTNKEAAFLPLGLLIALVCATTACSAPYRSFYYVSAGASLSTPIPQTRMEPAGRASFAPFEFGNVKSGLRPGWSVVGYPLEAEIRARSYQLSAAAIGGRLYLFNHVVKGTTTKFDPVSSGFTPKPDYYESASRLPARYQVVALGLEMKAAPLAFSGRGYDGFGEAALFVTSSIPHRFGWGLELRTGAQYAVESGGTLFARLEVTINGSRQRNPLQDEEEMTDTDWKASVDQKKESE